MEQEEIIERLEKIKFDKAKHKTIKEALKEIVESDKYAPAMRGFLTDKKLVNELQDIIKAYKELQEVDSREIEEAIELVEEETEDNYIEVIVDKENDGYYLKYKNEENGEYDDIKKFSNLQVEDNCLNDGNSIYNFLGKKIFDKKDFNYKEIYFVSDRIIELEDNKFNRVFISVDGFNRISFKDFDKKKFEHICTIFENINEKYINLFFNYIVKNKNLPYLEYEELSICDNYVYCVQDEEQCYFNLDGEKIISTSDCIYSEIFDMKKDRYENGKNHLAIVGGFDDEFNMVYGYYDLDERRQIGDLEFKRAYDFKDNCAAAINFNGETKFLTIDEKKVIKKHNGDFLKIEPEFQKEHLFLPIDYDNFSDNLYLVKVESSLYRNKFYIVVEDLFINPNPLCYIDCNFYDNVLYQNNMLLLHRNYNETLTKANKTIRREQYYYLNEEYKICELTIGEYLKRKKVYEEKDDLKKSLPFANNSSFLLPIYKEEKDNLKLLTSKKKNALALQSIFELANTPYISHKEGTSNINNNLFDCVVKDISFASDDFVMVKVITLNEKTLREKIVDCVINVEDGICIQNDNFKIKNIDYKCKTICVEVEYRRKKAGAKKYYLLDKLGNAIYGPFDNIEIYDDSYIITNKGKMQLYQNGVPINYQVDSISKIKKYYVSKRGIVLKEDYSLRVENDGNIYIVEEDGEKTLKQTQDILDLQNMLSNLKNDNLFSIEEKKVKTKKKSNQI